MGFNSSLFYLDLFAKKAGISVSEGSKILDAGAGESPYRKYFPHAKYESIDFCKVDKTYAAPTYLGSLESIPVANHSYDLILLTQVLEHVSNPLKVLRELNRVLKPGGKLWLSVPFYYPEHEVPFDYYRYTQYGLRHLLNESDFEIEELDWLEGYFGTVAFQLAVIGRNLPVNPRKLPYFPLSFPLSFFLGLFRIQCRALSAFFSRLDKAVKIVHSGHSKNYTVIARKRIATTHSPLP